MGGTHQAKSTYSCPKSMSSTLFSLCYFLHFVHPQHHITPKFNEVTQIVLGQNASVGLKLLIKYP